MQRITISDASSVVLAICALAVVAVMVKHELNPNAGPPVAGHTIRTVSKPQDVLAGGHRIGSDSAPVVIVEFGDFQCPVCRGFEINSLRPIEREYGNKVAVLFREWPLSYHEFAYGAARAAECANAQGRFPEFHDLLYDKQDSLGKIPYQVLAAESGVADTSAFIQCTNIAGKVPSIESDSKEALNINAQGTPTIVVDRTLLDFAPDSSVLDSIVHAALVRRHRS